MSNMYMPRGYMPPANIPQETPQGLALKKALGSGLFLAAAICYSLTVLVSVYGWFTPMAALAGTLSALFTQLPDIPGFYISQGEIYSFLNEYSSYLVGAKIGAAIPSILTCLALWLVYTGARKKSSVKGTAGLTILQVFAVLAVVGLILSTLIFGLAAIPVFAEHLLQSFLGLPKEAETAAIVVLILALVVVIFQIVYYCKLSSLYSGAKAMCRNERVKKPASLFVIVVAFIGVLSTLISLISGIVSSPVLYGVVNLPIILDMLSMVAAFVYTLLLAITYIRLRIAEEPFTRAAAARAAMASRTYAQTQQMQPGQIPYGQLVYGQPAQMPYGQPMNGQSAQVPYGQPMYGQPGQMPVQSEPEHSPEPKVQEETRGEEPAETENPLQE